MGDDEYETVEVGRSYGRDLIVHLLKVHGIEMC